MGVLKVASGHANGWTFVFWVETHAGNNVLCFVFLRYNVLSSKEAWKSLFLLLIYITLCINLRLMNLNRKLLQ
jgi:hypothetical protein